MDRSKNVLSIPPAQRRVLRVTFPQFEHFALAVANLGAAIGFYCPVFGLQVVEDQQAAGWVLLRRNRFALELREVAGLPAAAHRVPALVFSTDPGGLAGLRDSVIGHGGRILTDSSQAKNEARLLFTDPHASNVLECRGVVTPSAIYD